MAAAQSTGLERLTSLGTIYIDQRGRSHKGNKYTVHNGRGQVLFNLKEDGHVLAFFTKGSKRGFTIYGIDNTETNVFSLRRPTVFVTDKVELHVGGSLACVVRKEATFMTPSFNITDARDRPVLKIKGGITEYDFQLLTKNKANIGHIKKQFGGFLKEMFSYNDDYIISFPQDLDVRLKLAVIAACVLIDYRYHEN